MINNATFEKIIDKVIKIENKVVFYSLILLTILVYVWFIKMVFFN